MGSCRYLYVLLKLPDSGDWGVDSKALKSSPVRESTALTGNLLETLLTIDIIVLMKMTSSLVK